MKKEWLFALVLLAAGLMLFGVIPEFSKKPHQDSHMPTFITGMISFVLLCLATMLYLGNTSNAYLKMLVGAALVFTLAMGLTLIVWNY